MGIIPSAMHRYVERCCATSTVICTVKVEVAVAALAELANGRQQKSAAMAIFRFDGLTTG